MKQTSFGLYNNTNKRVTKSTGMFNCKETSLTKNNIVKKYNYDKQQISEKIRKNLALDLKNS